MSWKRKQAVNYSGVNRISIADRAEVLYRSVKVATWADPQGLTVIRIGGVKPWLRGMCAVLGPRGGDRSMSWSLEAVQWALRLEGSHGLD